MRVPFHRCLVAGPALFVMACSTAPDVGTNPTSLPCIDLRGSGHTEGTVHRLRGSGTFTFDDATRPAFVALYVFDLRDGENGGKFADVNYQFVWDDESFLTADHVFMEPILDQDNFEFTVNMTIVAGSGRFAPMVGEHPVSLDASFRVTAPPGPGDPPNAREEFTISGKLCGDQWQ